MKLIFSQTDDVIINDTLNGIAKALNYSGYQVGMITEPKKILDILYENKPIAFVYNNELKSEEEFGCNKYGVKPINIADLDVYADTFLYRKTKRTAEFHSKYTCINEYGTDDSVAIMCSENYEFQPLKLFQQKVISTKNYCGWLPKDFHSLILNSADYIICNHLFSHINHLLANENSLYFDRLIYTRNQVLENHTCFNGCFDILKLLDIDYDVERYLNKFLKETECM